MQKMTSESGDHVDQWIVEQDLLDNIDTPLQKAIESENFEEIKNIVDSIDNPNQSFYQSLFAACRQGNNDIIKILLNCKNVEIDKKLDYINILNKMEFKVLKKAGIQEKTALILAAEAGHLETLKLLEAHHADISQKTSRGNSALLLATKNNHLDIVKYLIETKGMLVDDVNMYKDTPLTLAASFDNVECVKYLIAKGADVLHINNDGKSILYNAVFSGNLSSVILVAESIPDDVLREHINHPTETHLFTALLWAAKQDYGDIVKYLLSKRADPGLKTAYGQTAIRVARSAEVKQLLLKADGLKKWDIDTPLQKAIESKNLEEIKNIVDSIENPNQSFYQSLFAACRRGNNDIIKILLKGKNIEIDKKLEYIDILSKRELKMMEKAGTQEKTALILAAESGHLETLKLLEAHHADINQKTSKGNSALLLASKNNHLDIVEYLIESKGMLVDDVNMYKDTALTRTANSGSLECMKYLMDKGADVLHISSDGKSILYNAVFSGDLNCVKLVAESIPDDVLREHINHPTEDHLLTALFWAAKEDYADIVKYLLSKGADPELRNAYNRTAFHVAKSVEVKKRLLKTTWRKFVKSSEKN